VTAELHPVHPGPDAGGVGRVHPDDELPQRRVDQVGDGAGAAAVVRLAPADQAVLGRHLHDHRVALDRPADPQRDALIMRDRERGREGANVGDPHLTQ
jgi:hypothetical protein